MREIYNNLDDFICGITKDLRSTVYENDLFDGIISIHGKRITDEDLEIRSR